MESSVEKLILTLSKREKAYINKFFLKNQSNTYTNYNHLYYHILKNGKIKKELLAKEIKDKKLLNNLSNIKEILLEKILECLINYNHNSNAYNIIQEYIQFIKLLIERNLKEKAQKFIIVAKQKAYRYEEYYLLLSIIEIEESLCFKNSYIINQELLLELNKEKRTLSKTFIFLTIFYY